LFSFRVSVLLTHYEEDTLQQPSAALEYTTQLQYLLQNTVFTTQVVNTILYLLQYINTEFTHEHSFYCTNRVFTTHTTWKRSRNRCTSNLPPSLSIIRSSADTCDSGMSTCATSRAFLNSQADTTPSPSGSNSYITGHMRRRIHVI
jgi:hypothetical protein